MLENNGQDVLVPLEIKPIVVVVGLSLVVKHLLIDSVLPQVEKLNKFYHHNIWSHVIMLNMLVKVVC